MAYSKDDFVNFSDIDKEELLGIYTASEFEISDSDNDFEIANSGNKSKCDSKTDKKLYECNECDKSYASISGIRGHLRSKQRAWWVSRFIVSTDTVKASYKIILWSEFMRNTIQFIILI